jgi:hypothetical protein
MGELTHMSRTNRGRCSNGVTSWPGGSSSRIKRAFTRIGGEALEPRALCSVSNLTANVSPAILRQINPMNQPHAVQVAIIRPVTLAGYVTESADTTPTVRFQVIDQNGRFMPSGQITPQFVKSSTPGPPNLFFFSKRFGLNRFRLPGDTEGRRYTVLVTAQDPQNSLTIAIPVTTPPVRR